MKDFELFESVLPGLKKAGEIKAFYMIVKRIVSRDVKSTNITNEMFMELGFSRRDQVLVSTKGLVDKGLIFRVKDVNGMNEFVFRYTINFKGVQEFRESLGDDNGSV